MRSLAEQQQSTRTLLTEGVDRELAREEFLRSPIYRDTLLSEDSRTTALQLNLAVDDHYYDLVGERDQLRLKARDEGQIVVMIIHRQIQLHVGSETDSGGG